MSTLCAAMDATDKCQTPSVDYCYAAFAEFTRKYIQSYLPDAKDVDVRFLPPQQVCRGSTLHAACVDYVQGQDVLYGYKSSFPASSFTYAELVQVVATRIMHA